MDCHLEFKLEIELGKCLDEVCDEGKSTLIVDHFGQIAEDVRELQVLPLRGELQHVVVHDRVFVALVHDICQLSQLTCRVLREHIEAREVFKRRK